MIKKIGTLYKVEEKINQLGEVEIPNLDYEYAPVNIVFKVTGEVACDFNCNIIENKLSINIESIFKVDDGEEIKSLYYIEGLEEKIKERLLMDAECRQVYLPLDLVEVRNLLEDYKLKRKGR